MWERAPSSSNSTMTRPTVSSSAGFASSSVWAAQSCCISSNGTSGIESEMRQKCDQSFLFTDSIHASSGEGNGQDKGAFSVVQRKKHSSGARTDWARPISAKADKNETNQRRRLNDLRGLTSSS